MKRHQPRDPDFEPRVRDSFARQGAMKMLGVQMTKVEPGVVVLEAAHRADLTQQHGFFHAGIVATLADSAGGYAAYTLFPAGSSVLTVEYKINLMAPADGEHLITTGRVLRSGRTLTVCEVEAEVIKHGARTTCAWLLQTVMCLENRADRPAGG